MARIAVPVLCLLLVTAIFARPLTEAAAAYQITQLPGLSFQPAWEQFSGYIVVNETAGRALFFWLQESTTDVEDNPLILWQTGGPGCSSLLAAFLENGAFQPTETGELEANMYAWNQIGSMLFVESPRNVGFSYSNTSSDNNVGDAETAEDILTFLQIFIKVFPQYAGSDLWLTGESYGGHYVPNTAVLLSKQNALPLNFRGFAVGNPWTDTQIDNTGCIDYWWTHALNSKSMSQQIINNCDLSTFGPLARRSVDDETVAAQPSAACMNALSAAQGSWGNISIYDVLVDVGCFQSSSAAQFISRHPLYSMLIASESARSNNRKRAYDPCGEVEISSYLNRVDVQTAIHALRGGKPVVWNECSPTLNYSVTDLLSSELPNYAYLLNETELSITVYSGDQDAIVPFLGTEAWVTALGRPVVSEWRAWVDDQGQTGGRVTVFDRLQFVTIRGAGHEVPMYEPGRAFVFLSSVVRGQPLPY